MEKAIVSTLGIGGFDDTKRALYALLLNEFVYVGVTGTSNNTGVYSPHKRLGAHVLKRGSTKSAIWDNVFAQGLVPEDQLAVRMISIHADTTLNVDRIEKAVIHALQQRFNDRIFLNKRERQVSAEITDPEQSIADEFTDTIIRKRHQWIQSNYDENTTAEL